VEGHAVVVGLADEEHARPARRRTFPGCCRAARRDRIDFTILYPSMTLSYLEMADDE